MKKNLIIRPRIYALGVPLIDSLYKQQNHYVGGRMLSQRNHHANETKLTFYSFHSSRNKRRDFGAFAPS
jgi:hypothetical protein